MLNIKHVTKLHNVFVLEIRKFDMLLLYKSQLVAAKKNRKYITLVHNRRRRRTL
jgi:hypothetical protein